jgi:hypothetical protein
VRVVEAHQAATGAEPQPALRIFMRAGHVIVDEAGRVAGVVVEYPRAVPVEAHQSRLRAEPHEPGTVLQHGQHRLLRQTLVEADMLEPQAVLNGPGHRHRREAAQQR